MKNKVCFGTLIAIFGFSYLMIALTLFDFFACDYLGFAPKFDLFQWLFDYSNTFLWCFACNIFVVLITAICFNKILKRNTKLLIHFSAVAVGFLIAFWLIGFIVREWFQISAGVFFLIYGIIVVAEMVKEIKTLGENKVNYYEEQQKDDPPQGVYYQFKTANFCAMIYAFSLSYLYWICFYGIGIYCGLNSMKLGYSSTLTFHITEIIDTLFMEETSLIFIFIANISLVVLSAVSLIFYRNMISRKSLIMLSMGFVLPILLLVAQFTCNYGNISTIQIIIVNCINVVFLTIYGVTGTVFMICDWKKFIKQN